MSYILDALRKADAQRERDPARGIHAQPVRGAIGERRLGEGNRAGIWAAAAGALAILTAAGWYAYRDQSTAPVAGTDVAVASPAREVDTATAPPASAAAPPPPPAAAVLPPPVAVAPPVATGPPVVRPPPVMLPAAPPAAPVAAAPVPATPAAAVPAFGSGPAIAATPVQSPPVQGPATSPMAPSGIAQLAAPTDAAPAEGMPAPAGPSVTESEAGQVPSRRSSRRRTAPTAAPGQAAPTAVPGQVAGPTAAMPPAPAPAAPAVAAEPVAGLPADAPRLVISGGVYSANVAQRLLIVNGQVFNQGSEVGAGVVLEEIKPKGAVLRYRGSRYTVTY